MRPQDVVSPELVLVDPELAERERARLAERMAEPAGRRRPSERHRDVTRRNVAREPLDARAASPATTERERPEPRPQRGRQGSSRRRGRWRERAFRGAALALLALIFAVGVQVGRETMQRPSATPRLRNNDAEPQREQAAASSVQATSAAASSVQATSAPTAPSSATSVRQEKQPAPQTFVWLPVADADYYNVRFFRGRSQVLEAWPKRPRITIAGTWLYKGREFRFAPGAYLWTVRPGFGKRGRRNLGPPIVRSTWSFRR